MIPPLSVEFVMQHAAMSIPEALWGVEVGLAEVRLLPEVATQTLTASASHQVALLAGLTSSELDEALDIARSIAGTRAEPPLEDAKAKWLYLALLWLYQHRQSYSDPFDEVEQLYVAFDYPAVMSPFIPYMPVNDDYRPQDHSLQENHERLFGKWARCLGEMAIQHQPAPPVP